MFTFSYSFEILFYSSENWSSEILDENLQSCQTTACLVVLVCHFVAPPSHLQQLLGDFSFENLWSDHEVLKDYDAVQMAAVVY